MKLLISGVREPENIAQLCRLNPEFIAFDFRVSSPRYIAEVDQALFSTVAKTIKKVGIFQSENALYITYVAGKYGLDAVQIEGIIQPRTLEILWAEGLEIIKVLTDEDQDPLRYEGIANKFLVRDENLRKKYCSKTPLIIGSNIENTQNAMCVEIGEEFESRVAYIDSQRIENWLKDRI